MLVHWGWPYLKVIHTSWSVSGQKSFTGLTKGEVADREEGGGKSGNGPFLTS